MAAQRLKQAAAAWREESNGGRRNGERKGVMAAKAMKKAK